MEECSRMTHPSVADAELADLIRATERERLRALVEADMVVAEQLHADDFQLINPFGGTATKAEYLEDIASGETNYLVFEPDCEIAVHVYGGAVAIRYISRIEIIVSGDPIPPGHYWHTDVYEQHEGLWQAVWSQATQIQ